jgi:surface protein
MTQMFYMAHSFNQDISAWDTSRVMFMDNMFCYAISFNQDLSKWNIRSVQLMVSMFEFARSFTYDVETAWKSTKMEKCDTDRWLSGTQYEYNK